MVDRVTLTQIAPVAWEHATDRAALQTLRALPGFDEVVRKVMGSLGERGLKHLFTANAVRVGPRQRPRLNALYEQVLATLDAPERYDLYLTQTPFVNAAAVGFEHPFIVLHSGTLSLLRDPEEQRVILGHELGHILSGHATYTTLALLLLNVGLRNLPFLTGLVLLPIELALMEWYRKAELSSDRAGLLASQNPEASMRLFLTLAGGEPQDDEQSLDEFLVQAAEYETSDNTLDAVFKVMNAAFRTHPFHTVRAAELQRWIQAGDYDRIRRGEYPKRSAQRERPLSDDYAAAAGYYEKETRDAVDQVSSLFRTAREAVTDALRGPSQ
ncbi:MAG TPA: M48 family metallopeptidase [Candidatus Tectomicrobia bacterium]